MEMYLFPVTMVYFMLWINRWIFSYYINEIAKFQKKYLGHLYNPMQL